MATALESIQALVKALEAGSYDAAPSKLTQGAALQMEDLSNVMQVVTFQEKSIKLQKEMKVDSCKSTLAQFDRQLSYGQFGGSAQLEGHVGQEETSQFVRITVPMCFYSHTRRVTLVATQVATVDGIKADERAAADAAKKIAADIEFDLFRGKADFSNAGVFDGNPTVIPVLPNILGVDAQVRMSDLERNTQDQMFSEYGADESIIISVGSTLAQENVEDAWTRSQMSHGEAEELYVDPKVLSNYTKITYNKERVMLAGSPVDATGSSLKKQWVSAGVVNITASRFLSGKTSAATARSASPAMPTIASVHSHAVAGVTTPFILNQVYTYAVTACNEAGESIRTAGSAVTIDASGRAAEVTVNVTGTVRYVNVYRGAAGSSTALKFIGRVMLTPGASSVVFWDLGNKQPGFVTGFLIEKESMGLKELTPYSRKKLAETELSQVEAHFRFTTLAVYQPRHNVLLDNLR